jgi:HSP20 family protein
MFTRSLTRWDPFLELSAQKDRMTRLFRELYSPEGPEETLTTTTFAPPVDVYEDEHNITLKIDERMIGTAGSR